MSDLQKEATDKLQEKLDQLAAAEARIREKEEQLEKLQIEKEQLEAEKEQLEQILKDYENQQKQLAQDKTDLEKHLQQITEDIAKMETEEKEQKPEIAELGQKQHAGGSNLVDVCFVVDLTSSMNPFINQLRSYMKELAEGLKKHDALKTTQIRFGVVGFRDFGDTIGPTKSFCDVTEFSTWISAGGNLVTQGGADPAEDVVGGLKRAVRLFQADSNTTNRFIVFLGDGAQHGRQYQSAGATVGLDDSYPNYPAGVPAGATTESLESIVKMMANEGIYFFGCSIREEATRLTYKAIKDHYPEKPGEEKKCMIDPVKLSVFSANVPKTQKYHFVFALDESGSMTLPIPGGGNRWTGLIKAFRAFLTARQKNTGQESIDTISVFRHATSVVKDTGFQNVPLSSINPATVPVQNMSGGGNHFDQVLRGLEPELKRIVAQDPQTIPILVFMSDGGDGPHREQAKQTMKRIATEIPKMQVIGILAFDQREWASCKAFCDAAGDKRSKFTQCGDSVDELVKTFEGIAGDHKSSAALVKSLGEEVLSSVVTSIASNM